MPFLHKILIFFSLVRIRLEPTSTMYCGENCRQCLGICPWLFLPSEYLCNSNSIAGNKAFFSYTLCLKQSAAFSYFVGEKILTLLRIWSVYASLL